MATSNYPVGNYLYTLNNIRSSTDLTRGFACLDTPQIITWTLKLAALAIHSKVNSIIQHFTGVLTQPPIIPWTLTLTAFAISRDPLMLAALATQSKVNSIIPQFRDAFWQPTNYPVDHDAPRSTLLFNISRGASWQHPIIPWTPKARCSRNTIQGQLYYSAFHGCVLATSNIPWTPIAHCVRNTIQGQLYYSTFHGVDLGNHKLSRGPL